MLSQCDLIVHPLLPLRSVFALSLVALANALLDMVNIDLFLFAFCFGSAFHPSSQVGGVHDNLALLLS
jgi:hypothetical protein